MKKFISLLLVLMLTFGMFSSVQVRKVEAAPVVALWLAPYVAGASFTAFMSFAAFFYANGYHIPINNLAVGFANQYYDYANGVYMEKGDKISFLEKLSLATSSFLSGNDPMTLADRNEIFDEMKKQYPTIVDVESLVPDIVYDNQSFNNYNDLTMISNQGVNEFKPEFRDKIIKIKTSIPEYFFYMDTTNPWYDTAYWRNPNIRLISPNGKVFNHYYEEDYRFLRMVDINTTLKTFKIKAFNSPTSSSSKYGISFDMKTKSNSDIEYQTVSDTFSSTGTNPFVAFPNYYAALNGKANNLTDLENLLNVDQYLQKEVADLLGNQGVKEENELLTPAINPDGTIYYPGTETSNPDIPDNPPYTPTETWYNNLFGWLVGMPGKIAEKVADIPILGDIVGGITDLVGRVTDIWDWLRTGLLGILQSILNAILDILAFLVGLPALLIQLLKDALIWLFVPDATFFNGKLEEFKLNFAFIDTFTAFIQRLEDMTSSNAIPTVTVDLSRFKGSFGGRPISMGAEAYILDMRWYLPFKAMGDLMFTAFVYVMFIWRFFGRLPEIISGGGLLYTADSKTDDLVRKLEGKKK